MLTEDEFAQAQCYLLQESLQCRENSVWQMSCCKSSVCHDAFESNAHHSNMHLPHTQDRVIGKQNDKRDEEQALELEVNVVGKQNDKRDELPGLALELEVKDLKDDMKLLKKEIHDLIIAMATRPLYTPRRSTLPTSNPVNSLLPV